MICGHAEVRNLSSDLQLLVSTRGDLQEIVVLQDVIIGQASRQDEGEVITLNTGSAPAGTRTTMRLHTTIDDRNPLLGSTYHHSPAGLQVR